MSVSIARINNSIAGAHRIQRRQRQELAELEAPAIAEQHRGALHLAAELGVTLDDWQQAAITTRVHDILLLVTRQGGKGEVATFLALDKILNDAGSTVVVVSRADRQAKRLLRRIKRRYRQLAGVPTIISDSAFAFELRNGSEILALPGSEETIRGIEAVDLLIVDEAALVPDELFAAVYPMLATTNGRCVAMSSARGKRGWFWHEWTAGGEDWHRTIVTWKQITRFKPEFIERTRRRIGDFMFRQEFGCEFLDTDDQLYATELVQSALAPDVSSFGLPTFRASE